jgi:hypothetical protein
MTGGEADLVAIALHGIDERSPPMTDSYNRRADHAARSSRRYRTLFYTARNAAVIMPAHDSAVTGR